MALPCSCRPKWRTNRAYGKEIFSPALEPPPELLFLFSALDAVMYVFLSSFFSISGSEFCFFRNKKKFRKKITCFIVVLVSMELLVTLRGRVYRVRFTEKTKKK